MANRNILITTPPKTVVTVNTKAGTAKGVLEFSPGFGTFYTTAFKRAQEYVDSEVLRFCSARVPFKSGNLQRSGILATVIGSGMVMYNAVYAAFQYYRTATSRAYDALRGGMWFERGKALEGRRILKGASSFFRR
jgi:hypothetical protein